MSTSSLTSSLTLITLHSMLNFPSLNPHLPPSTPFFFLALTLLLRLLLWSPPRPTRKLYSLLKSLLRWTFWFQSSFQLRDQFGFQMKKSSQVLKSRALLSQLMEKLSCYEALLTLGNKLWKPSSSLSLLSMNETFFNIEDYEVTWPRRGEWFFFDRPSIHKK